MKRLIWLIVFTMASAVSDAQSKDELAVREVLSKQVTAWNKGELRQFMNGYWQSDSLQFVGRSGITYGWNETLKNYEKHYPGMAAMGKLTFGSITLRQLCSNYIFVTGHWQLTGIKDNPGGYFTLIFSKINNQWLIISDHSSTANI